MLSDQEIVGRGDLDRLLTEWRSLLRQIVGAEGVSEAVADIVSEKADKVVVREQQTRALLVPRWRELQWRAAAILGEAKAESLPDLPPLTADQRRPVVHRFFKTVAASALRA
jgi:hypothetical protein